MYSYYTDHHLTRDRGPHHVHWKPHPYGEEDEESVRIEETLLTGLNLDITLNPFHRRYLPVTT